MSIPTDAWVKIGAATTPVFSKDGRTLFHLRGAGLPQVWAPIGSLSAIFTTRFRSFNASATRSKSRHCRRHT